MKDTLRSRFSDAPWMKNIQEQIVVIGGAGGIGSWLTLLLSRMGPEIVVYDFDKIEEHNIGGQWFKKGDIGSTKVSALRNNVRDFSNIDVSAMNEKVTDETLVSAYCFSAFDNMEARKDLFNAWKKANKDNPNALFIDGRLAAEQWEIYCIRNTPEDIAYYENPEILFEDSEIPDAPCTMKQTSHFAAQIASFMSEFFTNHLTNVNSGELERRLPKKVSYIGQLNIFKSEY